MFRIAQRLGAVRGVFSRARHSGALPKTRVSVPSVRPQSPELLRRLREYGAGFDYFVNRDGSVLLLDYQPGKPRQIDGRFKLYRGSRAVDDLLQADGFSLLDHLGPHAIDNGELLRRAEQIAHATPKAVEAEHDRLLRASDGTDGEIRAERHMRDRVESEAKSDYRILMKHRVSFSRVRSV